MNLSNILVAIPDIAGRVEIVGEGPLADELRQRLGDRAQAHPNSRPTAIIETTGEPAAIVSALQRVEDLGTVVLAGPCPSDAVALDLYADVHVRGLTIIGVA